VRRNIGVKVDVASDEALIKGLVFSTDDAPSSRIVAVACRTASSRSARSAASIVGVEKPTTSLINSVLPVRAHTFSADASTLSPFLRSCF
jgi:hypothetical protein